ncbi:MAG: lamin tail domain-containing protein [Bacteroidetes bacterium]|nr:lamin tail domain-containing protein [Bacteroidota bacterium]
MKKTILALAAITLIFSSCVKNDPYEEPENSELKGNLFLNEINGTGGPSQLDTEKYVELFNKTNAAINLKDFSLDYGGTETWRGRADDMVPAHGYKLIKGAKTTYPGMSTGLSSRNANVNLTLLDPSGNIVDYYEKIEDLNGKPLESMDHMRIPDGGKWYFVEISAQSPDAPNLTDPNHPSVRGAMPAMEKGLRIDEVMVSNTRPTPADAVTIVAKVTDVNEITSVVLKWKKDGASQTDIAMELSITVLPGGGYVAAIPNQPDGTVVEWTVVAANNKGNTATESGSITWTAEIIDYSGLKFNEVSGAGNDEDKFYELINTGSTPINLAGCTIHYNANGANGGVLPTGEGNLTWTGSATQIIEAGKLFCLIGRNTPGSFTTGLTAARILIITLKDPAGNILDQCIRAEDTGKYAFTDKSFSRIPDGTGPFYFTTPTPNVMNGSNAAGLVLVPITQEPQTDYTKLKLNEVSGVGSDNEKFYELINTGSDEINLEGCQIFYNANGSNGGTLPAGEGNLTWTGSATQVIEAGKLFSLIGRNAPGSFTTGLTAARILIITLKDPDGNVIDRCIRAEDTGAYDFGDKSFSRIPDGTGPFYFTTPTPNVMNGSNAAGLVLVPEVQGAAAPDYSKLVLNEVSGNNKYVEIYNSGTEDIPLAGVKLQRNNGSAAGGSEWSGTVTDVIPAGAYRLFLFNSYTPAELNTNPAYTGWTVGSGISSGQILKVAIVDPSGNPVSVFIRGDVPLPAWQVTSDVSQNTTDTYSRMADGTWAYAAPTPGAPNGTKTSEILNPGYLTAQP